MARYLLKQYHRSLPEWDAGKLIMQKAVEVADDDAAIAAAQRLLRKLSSNEFIRLEDQAGHVVACWIVNHGVT
jgi:hypothetical protein